MTTPSLYAETYAAVTVDRLFADLRVYVGLDQPAPVPASERTTRLRETQRRAIVKVKGDLRFVGAAVVCGLAANA